MSLDRFVLTPVTASVFAGIYLLLAESFDALELVAAGLTGVLAALTIAIISQHSEMHFRLRVKWLADSVALPVRILRDSAAILAALPRLVISSRSPIGTFKALPLKGSPHHGNRAEVAGWRAFTILSISMPPNTYVVRLDDARMVVHQLLKRGQHSGVAQ